MCMIDNSCKVIGSVTNTTYDKDINDSATKHTNQAMLGHYT